VGIYPPVFAFLFELQSYKFLSKKIICDILSNRFLNKSIFWNKICYFNPIKNAKGELPLSSSKNKYFQSAD
jgi:hypothetical protein